FDRVEHAERAVERFLRVGALRELDEIAIELVEPFFSVGEELLEDPVVELAHGTASSTTWRSAAPAATVTARRCVVKPSATTESVRSPGGAARQKRPRRSVRAPTSRSASRMRAPVTGAPDASTTSPQRSGQDSSPVGIARAAAAPGSRAVRDAVPRCFGGG